MHTHIRLVVTIVLLSLSSMMCFADQTGPKDLGSGKYVLSERQVIEFSQAALKGDARSAIKLSDFYGFFRNDIVESNFWLQLAAELSDCGAIRDYLGRVKHVRYLNTEERVERWTRREQVCTGHAQQK
jgi:hypothetical protein